VNWRVKESWRVKGELESCREMDKSAFIVSEGPAVFIWVIKLNYREHCVFV
jgi:hypothetical protein